MSTAYSCTVEPDFCAVMPDDSMTGAGIYSCLLYTSDAADD